MTGSMPKRTLTNLIEIQDFARGATFFGTGGGGAYETGVELLQEQFEAGREIGWVDIADIPDDIFTASAFGMGSYLFPGIPLKFRPAHSRSFRT